MKITVFADSGWDYTYVCEADGEFPRQATFSSPGFKGANQAVAASRAGADVSVISLVGDDDIGRKVISNFKSQKVNADKVITVKGRTTDKFIIWIDSNGDNKITGEPELYALYTEELVGEHSELLKGSRFVITNACLPTKFLKYLVDLCAVLGIDVIFTPCYDSARLPLGKDELEMLRKIKYITANEKESLRITNCSTIEEAVRKLPNLIATKGAGGVYFMDGGKVVHLPAVPVEKVVDTSGAGDTFCGFFAASLAAGNDLVTSVKRGLVAASLKIQKRGAQISMPTGDEVTLLASLTKI